VIVKKAKELSRPTQFPKFWQLDLSYTFPEGKLHLLKMERFFFIDLLSPLTLRERHFRSSVKMPQNRIVQGHLGDQAKKKMYL